MTDDTTNERDANWPVVLCCQSDWEAEMARALLEDKGIPAVVRSYLVGPYAGALSSGGPCAAEVKVPAAHRAAAETLLAGMRTDGE